MSWTITPTNLLPDDADAVAYIAAVEAADTAAGSPGGLEPAVRLAINTFIKGCKADGIWPSIKASCILAGARTLNGALVPLRGTAPTNNGPFVAGDYNRKTGLVGDGSTKYLDSNRASNADPQNSKHFSVYGTNLEIGTKLYLGAYDASGKYSALFSSNSSDFYFNNNVAVSTNSVVGGLVLSGVHGFAGSSRSSATLTTGRRAGANYTANAVSVAPSSVTAWVFGGRGLPASFFTTSRLAFYSIGESLDLALFDARVTDLINAFGAAIP